MMIEWNYIIITTSLLLFCFLLWKEVTRAKESRLIWRIIASFLAVVNLACIALPVAINSTKTISKLKEAILLTEGFDKDSVQKFIRSNSGHYSVYSADPAIVKSSKSFETKFIAYSEISNLAPGKIPVLHVFGYGLRQDEMEQLQKIPIVFHSSKIPDGITSISWKQKLIAGEKLRIQGRYNNSLSTSVKIILIGVNTTLDSLDISKNTSKSFELATIPKHIDKAVFSLWVIKGKDTIEAEDIPIEVTQPKTFRVLMLASSPDFENKFLKEWLSEYDYSIAYRSRISKDKFQKGYINVSAIPLNRVTSSVLNEFDLMISDTDELEAISKSELRIIQSAVQNEGLGLIVKADSSISSASFYAKNFSIVQSRKKEQKETFIHLKGSSGGTPKIIIDHSANILPRSGTASLIKDEKSSILTAKTLYGTGKIILTTLTNTYTLILSGNQESYNAVWSLLLNEVVKKGDTKESISIQPALPRVNEPAQYVLRNTYSDIKPIMSGENIIYLQQDKLLPFLYTGVYWPEETGWVPQVNTEGQIHWMYVYKEDNWKTLYAYEKIISTKKYALKISDSQTDYNEMQKKVPVLVPKIYFFFIFIISCGFLWFEKKLP